MIQQKRRTNRRYIMVETVGALSENNINTNNDADKPRLSDVELIPIVKLLNAMMNVS